ncbi:MAG TPA: hypothetical protein VF228_12315 [Iamia sp.]
MRARPPVTRVEAGHLVVRTEIVAADGSELAPIEVRIPVAHADLFDPTATPGAATLATVAALRGEDLVIEGAVDVVTAERTARLGLLLSDWWGTGTTHVEVEDTYVAPPSEDSGDGVGLFFTRGADSWSTLLDLLDEPVPDRVTHLISIHHGPPDLFRAIEAGIHAGHRRVAAELGLELVVAETTARHLLDPHRRWADTSTTALVATGLQVATGLRRLVFSGAHPVGVHTRTGADPDVLDALGTSRTEVVLGNPHRSRHERIAHLASDPLARSTLQVCWEGMSAGNCGRCRKCQLTMSALALAGDPDPTAGFAAGLDPAVVRQLELGPELGSFLGPLIDGLPPEHEELRRAWSDAWERNRGIEPRPRWGDDAPPGLAGPGVPQRVATALWATTGQPVAPAPAPLGWRGGAVPLRPPHDRHEEIRALADTARPHAWAVVEHHIRDGARDGHQADLAFSLAQHHGPGPCYLPGILWAHLDPPVLDPDAVRTLLRTARARLWWRADGDLEPLRVVEAVEQGCLPLQVMPPAAAHDLAGDLPSALAPLVIDETTLADLDLSPTAVATRLGPVVDHLLSGSTEHDLLAGAYQ